MMVGGKSSDSGWAVEALYKGSQTISALTGTFASVPLGTAHANRQIIVFLSSGFVNSGKQWTAVSVGGTSLTEIVSQSNTYRDASIFYGNIPTGTSADIVVTQSSTGTAYPHIGVISVAVPFTVESTVSAAARSVGALSVSRGALVLGESGTGSLSPTGGDTLSSSPTGLSLNTDISKYGGNDPALRGWIENADAGTYTITGSWTDSTSNYSTSLGASLVRS